MSTRRETAAADVSDHVVAVVQAGLPLGAGLRAAADESQDRQLAAALRKVGDAIDAGQPLAEALAKVKLPGSLPAILTASVHSGRLREAVFDLVDHEAATREALRTAYAALAYPVALSLFSYACFLLVQWVVVGELANMYRDFELPLPEATKLVVRLYELGWWQIAIPVGAVSLAAIVLACLRPARRQRVIAALPMFGSMLHWCGVAQAARALGHLVRQQVPLPEALRLSAQGLRDANVAEVWTWLADEVATGRSLSETMLSNYRLPASLAPLVHWGERTQNLAESLFTASEMLEGRVRLRAQMLRTVLPPVMFLVIGSAAFFLAAALMGPMINLIRNLSG